MVVFVYEHLEIDLFLTLTVWNSFELAFCRPILRFATTLYVVTFVVKALELIFIWHMADTLHAHTQARSGTLTDTNGLNENIVVIAFIVQHQLKHR